MLTAGQTASALTVQVTVLQVSAGIAASRITTLLAVAGPAFVTRIGYCV